MNHQVPQTPAYFQEALTDEFTDKTRSAYPSRLILPGHKMNIHLGTVKESTQGFGIKPPRNIGRLVHTNKGPKLVSGCEKESKHVVHKHIETSVPFLKYKEEPKIYFSDSKKLQTNSSPSLPQLTPIPKPNYIEELKRELLNGLTSNHTNNNHKILSPLHNEDDTDSNSIHIESKFVQTAAKYDEFIELQASSSPIHYPSSSYESKLDSDCNVKQISPLLHQKNKEYTCKTEMSFIKESHSIDSKHDLIKQSYSQEGYKNQKIYRSNSSTNLNHSQQLDVWPIQITSFPDDTITKKESIPQKPTRISEAKNFPNYFAKGASFPLTVSNEYNRYLTKGIAQYAESKRKSDKKSLVRPDMLEEGNVHENHENKVCPVRVAVRIRPQSSREQIDMCRNCTKVIENEPQIIIGTDKAFTFDYVFDVSADQEYVYTTCVQGLVDGALHGYNGTILAYGQTGSGKTFTMGSGFDNHLNEKIGIIPRAVEYIFSEIKKIKSSSYITTGAQNLEFSVAVQFIELYNEEIIDLLDPNTKTRLLKIQENVNGYISIVGTSVKQLNNCEDALKYLQQGALARSTASTKMNDESSRSHALYTIFIKKQCITSPKHGYTDADIETTTSKLNFVDLAGSERLKRTGATGERAREGISINSGLLALGNCISALGDKSKKATHIPYRDSKLTRLLQDSLGGNSQTLMIACISPSDRDFIETLNTLKYANRARNIKNKIYVNQDQTSRTISQLRREVASLQVELLEYKQGKRFIDDGGNILMSDTHHENLMLSSENKRLQLRVKAMQDTINTLVEQNTVLKLEKKAQGWSSSTNNNQSLSTIVAGYLSEIEKLQAKLIESDAMYLQLKKIVNTNRHSDRLFIYQNDDVNSSKLTKSGGASTEEKPLICSTRGSQLMSDTDNSEEENFDINIHGELDDLNSDIELKTKLVEQLELSQQRMGLLRYHYEEKLGVLNCKIRNIQKERDDVLARMRDHGSNIGGNIIDDYETKINILQRELNKLQAVQKEHIRQQQAMKIQETKVQNLHLELTELKRIKARLIRKISEQTNLHRVEDSKRNREIAQLKKTQRQQCSTLKSLQTQIHVKDQILKRKTEEVFALQRTNRLRAKSNLFDSNINNMKFQQLRENWEKINEDILNAARHRQVVHRLETELECLIKKREHLSEVLKVNSIQLLNTNETEILNDEDNIKSNLNYLQENITQIQQTLLELEESENSSCNILEKVKNYFTKINDVNEAKYLLQRLMKTTMKHLYNSILFESECHEQKTILKEIQKDHDIQRQLLYYFLTPKNCVQMSDLLDTLNALRSNLNSSHSSDSKGSLKSNATYDIPQAKLSPITPTQDENCLIVACTSTLESSTDRTFKIRSITANPKDLLFEES